MCDVKSCVVRCSVQLPTLRHRHLGRQQQRIHVGRVKKKRGVVAGQIQECLISDQAFLKHVIVMKKVVEYITLRAAIADLSDEVVQGMMDFIQVADADDDGTTVVKPQDPSNKFTPATLEYKALYPSLLQKTHQKPPKVYRSSVLA